MQTNKEKFLVYIQLKLYCTQHKSPAFILQINGQTVDITNPLAILGHARFGDNILSIEFTNKDSRDTKLDNNGNIVEDLAIEIENCLIDNLDFTSDLKINGVYQTNNGFETTHGFLHTNGIFSYKFTCPGFYHLRNNGILNFKSIS